MQIVSIELAAGVSKSLAVGGKYFRILSSAADVKMDVMHDGGGSLSTQMLAGIGVNLSSPDDGRPYKQITFLSTETQAVRFACSYYPVDDSRLTGDVDINGLLSVVNNGGSVRNSGVIVVAGAGAKKLRDTDLSRLKCALHFPVDVYMGKDATVSAANGFPLLAGSKWLDENTAELWAYFGVACSVPFIEDLK